jgi:hypothetical protein
LGRWRGMLAAQLTTLPVVLYHFRRLSLVSLFANPLIPRAKKSNRDHASNGLLLIQ